MPRNRTYSLSTNVPTVVETVVASVQVPSTHYGEVIDLEGSFTFTPGTGATGLVARIRRGSDATGALVGHQASFTVSAGQVMGGTLNVNDAPPESEGLNYVLTLTQAGASANGTLEQAGLVCLWGI